MELHLAIRRLIEEFGVDIVKNKKLINALMDIHGFDDYPSMRNIIRLLLADGYVDKLIKCGSWGAKAQSIAQEFANSYSIVPEMAELAVCSLAYGIGMMVNLPPIDSHTTPNSISKAICESIVVQNDSKEGFIKNDNLIYVTDKFYIRKDWYERSGIVFQDITIEKTYNKFIHQNQYHLKCELLSNTKLLAMRRLSIIGFDKDGRIVYLDDIHNLELKGSGYGKNFYIKDNMFLPLDAYVRNLDNVEKYIICIETSLGLYDTKTLKNVFSSPTIMSCLSGDVSIFSCFFLYKENENTIFYYYEIDSKKGFPMQNSHLCIYNKEGKLKQQIDINTDYSFINKSNDSVVYMMSETFNTRIPVSKIGKIAYINT